MNSSFLVPLVLLVLSGVDGRCDTSESLFADGVEAYRQADYDRAAKSFGEAIVVRPSAGTLQNLGKAEWQRGQTGPAIVAWAGSGCAGRGGSQLLARSP